MYDLPSPSIPDIEVFSPVPGWHRDSTVLMKTDHSQVKRMVGLPGAALPVSSKVTATGLVR